VSTPLKRLTMTRQSFCFANNLVVAVALSLGSTAGAHAAEITVTINLAPLTATKPITVPKNTPVLVMGNSTIPLDFGVAQVTMQVAPNQGLQWAGYSTFDGFVSNFWPAAFYIIAIDFRGCLVLGVDPATENSFLIGNNCHEEATGTVKLIY
jgi:hypothetical protein